MSIAYKKIKNNFTCLLNLCKYIWCSFHAYFISILCCSVVFVYYIYFLVGNYYIDVDIYINKIIDDKYVSELSENILDKEYDNISIISIINTCIDNNKINEAIYLIDKVKNKLNKEEKLYKYLELRQALIMIKLSDNLDDYLKNVRNKYPELYNDYEKNFTYVYTLYKKNYVNLN